MVPFLTSEYTESREFQTGCVSPIRSWINSLGTAALSPLKFGIMLIARNQLKTANLNLNSLLVKRQIDNPSPGAVTGGN